MKQNDAFLKGIKLNQNQGKYYYLVQTFIVNVLHAGTECTEHIPIIITSAQEAYNVIPD